MVSIVALIIWRLNPFIVLFGFLVFGSLDGVYLSSALTKVPDGAWFTLVLAMVLSSIFILWRFGKEQQWKAEAEDRFLPSHLLTKDHDGELHLTQAFGGGSVSNIKGTYLQVPVSTWSTSMLMTTGFGIFFDKAGSNTPTVFIQFLSKFVATPDVMVFFHLRPLSTPSIPVEERYTVSRIAVPNCFRVVIRHGYMDDVFTEDLSVLIFEEIRNFIIREVTKGNPTAAAIIEQTGEDSASSGSPPSSSEPESEKDNPETDIVKRRLADLQRAYNTQVVYIIGKEQMRIRSSTRIWRRVALNAFLWLRDNTRSKMANLHIPVEKLVEVGFVKEV